MIWEALPIESRVNLWGKEIYFQIPVDKSVEDGKSVIEAGTLEYWPPGNALSQVKSNSFITVEARI